MEADWYEKLRDGKVRCSLCPHFCTLADGKYGNCRVRVNHSGEMHTEIFGKVSAMHTDPIEKKPLYHYFPGRTIYSIGSVGCNLKCRFCQNSEISQVSLKDAGKLFTILPKDVVASASVIPNSIGIAFTYNEPSIWIEFVEKTALEARRLGLKNVMVTNGYINPLPLQKMIEYIDAFSVDLKAYTDSFYRSITSSSLAPVKRTLELIRNSGRHLEVINLVIPGLNDDPHKFEEMIQWIDATLGKDTIFHLSAYFPRYLANEPPTPESTINNLMEISKKYLRYVYAGNLLSSANDTFCPNCGELLIRRSGYRIDSQKVLPSGKCSFCDYLVFENF